MCRDASKFKLLRTTYIPARDNQRKTPTVRPVVPPSAKCQAAQAATQETTPVAAPIATQGIVTVLLKRDKKRKGETPFEPYIYIATKVIGSTIHARRASDGKTVCQDASKFKLLRTTYIPARDNQRKTPTVRPVVPPSAKCQAAQAATQETTPVAAPIATQGTVTRQVPIEATPTNQTLPLCRSQRQTKSTFQGSKLTTSWSHMRLDFLLCA